MRLKVKRRSFIKKTSVAAAAIAVAPNLLSHVKPLPWNPDVGPLAIPKSDGIEVKVCPIWPVGAYGVWRANSDPFTWGDKTRYIATITDRRRGVFGVGTFSPFFKIGDDSGERTAFKKLRKNIDAIVAKLREQPPDPDWHKWVKR